MADKTTFIKIDRNIVNWGWFRNSKVLSVFIWLIIKANIKQNRFEKDTIPRGSLVTSNSRIAEECGLTIDNVRTALANLEVTGEITREKRSRYQIIRVVNYEAYQSGIIKTGYQIPIKSQSNPNQPRYQIPINKEYNNGKNGKNKRKTPDGVDSPDGGLRRGTDAFRNQSHKLLKPDEGTVDDIPQLYRGIFDNFAEYWRYRNQ